MFVGEITIFLPGKTNRAWKPASAAAMLGAPAHTLTLTNLPKDLWEHVSHAFGSRTRKKASLLNPTWKDCSFKKHGVY